MGINSEHIKISVKLENETYIRLRDATARLRNTDGSRVTIQEFVGRAIENELKRQAKAKAS